jgi:hypothetical protein
MIDEFEAEVDPFEIGPLWIPRDRLLDSPIVTQWDDDEAIDHCDDESDDSETDFELKMTRDGGHGYIVLLTVRFDGTDNASHEKRYIRRDLINMGKLFPITDNNHRPKFPRRAH